MDIQTYDGQLVTENKDVLRSPFADAVGQFSYSFTEPYPLFGNVLILIYAIIVKDLNFLLRKLALI